MQTMLITGGTGFLGRALAQQFKNDYHVILCGRNNELNEKVRTLLQCKVVPIDVTNMDALRETFAIYRPDIVIHAAATKYVHLAEQFPNECLDINIKGSQNVGRAAIEFKVCKVIGVSTDKASSPVSFYGLTKNVMERLFSLSDKPGFTRFANVRFGNLAWSTGSVFPLWKKMLEESRLIETTGRHMSRFFMPLDAAVSLVKTAIENIDSIAGGTLCPMMKTAKMADILDAFIRMYGGTYKDIAARVGENPGETLINLTESLHTRLVKFGNQEFYVIDQQRLGRSNEVYEITTENQEVMGAEEIRKLVKFDMRSYI